ncbi:uncharacterized protein LOC129723351 [Wyeomyia smithii]|uniref:uncharacterized protein LOC129723351 n=1 Tax=Wyeomyia smithii TaxID=174621 RepID=UPI00246821E3|nr:uncharacterized protein LOC129723351 [Wyeomyia smithii]
MCPPQQQSYPNINDLPLEVLEHILSYLCLADRKDAALVCRYWEQLALSYRAMEKVKLSLKMNLEYSAQVLQQSWRPYRVLEIDLRELRCSEFDLEIILMILDRVSDSLEALHLYAECTASQLRQIVCRTPKLKELRVFLVKSDDGDVIKTADFPVLPGLKSFQIVDNMLDVAEVDLIKFAPNLCHLSLESVECREKFRWSRVLQSVGPQLKSLKIVNKTNIWDCTDEFNFRQLKTLEIQEYNSEEWSEDMLKKILTGAPNLSSLSLNFQITRSLLEVICCLPLTNLKICVASKLGKSSFRCLEKLTNLKVLHVKGYLNCSMLADCKPLPSVREFHLTVDTFPIDHESIIKRLSLILPQLRTFRVSCNCSQLRGNDFVRQICKSFEVRSTYYFQLVN